LKGRNLLEQLSIVERIILKWILENRVGRSAVDSPGSGQGPMVDRRECGNEPSGSIRNEGSLDWLSRLDVGGPTDRADTKLMHPE